MVSILTLVLIVFGIIGAGLAAIGGVLLFKKMKYDRTATATITNVTCQEEGAGKCRITVKFTDQSDNEITGTAIVSDKPAKDSKRKIMYDSENPSVFYPSVPPVRAIGAGMFFGGIFVLIVCVGIAIFRFVRSRPAAAAATPQHVISSPDHPSPSPQEQLPQPEPAEEKSSWLSPFSPKSSPAVPERPEEPQADASPKSAKSRSSRKPEPVLVPDMESLRAKQYADQMVQKVAEPARKSPSWF